MANELALTSKLKAMHLSQNLKPYRNDVHCYLDCSGSMAGAQIIAAKAALNYLFDGLDDDDGICLYKFSETIDAVKPIKEKKKTRSTRAPWLKLRLKANPSCMMQSCPEWPKQRSRMNGALKKI
jgi:hypothetical protein